MRYTFEKILTVPTESLVVEIVEGKTVDCIFHFHPEYELTFVESSFGCRYIGNHMASFSPGDLVLAGSMLPHYYYSDIADSNSSNWSRLVVMQFPKSLTELNFIEFDSIKKMLQDSKYGLYFPFRVAELVQADIQKIHAVNGMERLLLFWKILKILSTQEYQILNTTTDKINETIDKNFRMNKIVQAIHSAIERGEDVSLGKIAKVANMSQVSFSKYFHKQTRTKFIDYILELKLSLASNWLTQSNMQIWEIASRAGFNNLSNFNRQFKRKTNLSPRAFRKKWQQN